MLFYHTKRIVLISLSLALLSSVAVGQQYYPGPRLPDDSSRPGPGSVQMQSLPGQSVPGQAVQYVPQHGRPASVSAWNQPYAPSPFQIAQLPAPAQPGVPSLIPQQPAPIQQPAPAVPASETPKTFEPKPSQPEVVHPKSTTSEVPSAQDKQPVPDFAISPPGKTIMRKLENASERMEMVVNTSQILTLDKSIPQAQVNNPEILNLTPLSPKQIQLSAKKPGVTQVNIWSDSGQIYSIDVLVVGDAEELRLILEGQFPSSSLKIVPVGLGAEGSGSVYISGYVDRPENVLQITQIAEQYYPKVINNVTVSGVQQVLLHAKVMEVSRTKLRTLGVDWAQFSGNNLITSGVSGLLGIVPGTYSDPATLSVTGDPTFQFSVIQGENAFFGIMEALREDQLAKVLAEPTLVTVNGQPASFLVGGEIPVPVPQSLGTISIEYKKYGTQLNFVPLVLGDGRIRMEVRPRVSEIDRSTALFMDGFYIYGFRSREVKTSVEMDSGQTLAIAGLINQRIESERRGLPWVSDVPFLGAFFRRVTEKNNEIEMLIFVTPELVDAMNPDEVPMGGPGANSCSPTDCQLYWKGHIETDCCDTGGCGCRTCTTCNSCDYGVSGGCAEGGMMQDGMRVSSSPSREVGRRRSEPMRRVPLGPVTGVAQAAPSRTSKAASLIHQNRYKQQGPIREASTTALPGFQGRLGY